MDKNVRIISLLPGATEIVCGLGLSDRLVGRSHECDYPSQVERLPVCSRPKYIEEGNSKKINRSVQEILRDALSIYEVDVERIKALNPTHILTQSQCEVCAVSTRELENALKEVIRQEDITVIDSNPESLDDIFAHIQQVADATDTHQAGMNLVQDMKRKFESIRNQTKDIQSKPMVAHIEWIEPLMVGGHWMPTLIEWAGGILKPAELDEDERWLSFEVFAEQNPEKIIIAPCGFSIRQSLDDLIYLEQQKDWMSIKAVENDEVYICNGSAYFNRPGPRLTDSLEILAEIYHPQMFPQRHDQSAWIRNSYAHHEKE
jgi:iron complex transport system substrate-binding protein